LDRDLNLFLALQFVVSLCCFVPLSVVSRVFATQRQELNRQMRSFTFSEARSCCEEDRHLLNHIISTTYRRGDPAESGDNGMARFEQDVRSRMPTVVNDLMGLPSVVPTKLLVLFGTILWVYALDSLAASAALPAAVFGGERGKALYLFSDAANYLAFSFGIVPLTATASIALASIRLGPKRVAYGADLAMAVIGVLVPSGILVGGAMFTQSLVRWLPNASIPVNLLVLGIALTLTKVRPSHCGRLGACGGVYATRVAPAPVAAAAPTALHVLPARLPARLPVRE
jgi:hypothetical protein